MRLRSRRRLVASLAAALLVVAVAVAGFVVGRARTPAQDAARALPPAPTELTMPVEKGPLVDAMTLSASLVRQHVAALPLGSHGGNAVVTRVATRVGEWVRPGSLLCDISGQPVLVLPGSFPAYRDLKAGDAGPDVRQLQAGLSQSGRSVPVTGTVDAATLRALTGLYANWGYRFDGALPASAIAYAPHLPARLTRPLPGPGPLPENTQVHLDWGDLGAAVPLTADVAERWRSARPAPTVTVDGARGTTVRLVSLAPAPSGADGQGRGAATPEDARPSTGDQPGAAPDDTAGPPGWIARFALTPAPTATTAPVSLRVVFARSSAGAVVVPIAAVVTDAAGQVVVTRRDAAAARHDVPVRVEFAVDGRVAVVPTAGALKVGDDVVIGTGPQPS